MSWKKNENKWGSVGGRGEEMCMKRKRVGGGDPVSSSLLSAECWVDRMGLFVISLTLVAPAFGHLSNDFLSPQTGLAPCLAPLHSTGDLANFLGLLRNGNGHSPHPPIHHPSCLHAVFSRQQTWNLVVGLKIWYISGRVGSGHYFHLQIKAQTTLSSIQS